MGTLSPRAFPLLPISGWAHAGMCVGIMHARARFGIGRQGEMGAIALSSQIPLGVLL